MACSLFLGIWRCIVGVDDDNQERETLPNNRDISPYYDTPPRSYVPTATNSTTTASCAYVPPQIPASSYSDSWNSARTKLPEALNIYSVKPKAAIHSSAATRPEASIRTPGKSHEAGAQKPKLLAPSPLHTHDNSHEATAQKTNKAAPSPFPADFSLKRQAVDHGNDETSLQTLPSELSSSSSQPLPSLTKSVASSSKTLPYASTPRSPPQPPVSSFSSPLSSSEWLAPCSRTLSPVPKRAPSPVLPSSSSSFGNPLSLPKPRQPSNEPLASLVPSNPTNLNSKTTKVQVEKDASSIFMLASSSKTLPFVATPPPPTVSSLSSAVSFTESLAPCSRILPPVSTPPPPPVSPSSSYSLGRPPSTPPPEQPSSKPLLPLAPPNPTNPNSKTTKVWVEKDPSSVYSLTSSSKTLPSVSTPPPPPVSSLSSPVSLTEWNAPCPRTLPPVSMPPPPLSSSSLGTPLSTPKPQQPSSKPLLPLALSNPTNPNSKTTKVWVEKDPSSVYSLTSSSKTLPSVSTPPPPPVSSLSSPVPLTEWNVPCPSTLPHVSVPPPPPVSPLSSSSSGTPPSTPKPRRPSSKPILSPAPPNPTNTNSKTNYVWVKKDTSSIYAIPKDFKILIKNDVVPEILERPLSPSTYKDYFEALLYAEDFYLEKWDKFEMENVTLELEEASIYKRKGKYNKKNMDDEKDDKLFVTFELDSIPERRPFLLSRDFVFVSPSGTRAEPLQGLIYRVVKSNRVLVEFGEDFHARHYKACKYDVKFSFNRVCLKRAHQAVATVSDPLFRNLLFPDSLPKNRFLTAQLQSIISNPESHQISAVRHILSHQNAVPYLVEGPLARTRDVVCEAVLQLYRTSPSCRILICAPTNRGCDDITRSFMGKIPKSSIFRANAAFRELGEVPEDILASCLYKKKSECFSCPSIHKLQEIKVISSTFMSSFRLHNEGIMAGHFSHIFLVDASTIIEPEAMVPLANLANESTVVTVTGGRGDHSRWIRSPIARWNGLLISYFERLRQSKLYDSLDSKVITVL